MSHQQEGHTETGPWFKVLSERHEKQGINLAIPGMVNQSVVHFTITTPQMKKKLPMKEYPFCYKTGFVFLPKESQKSRTIIKDRSRSWGLFRKGKTCIIAKFYRTDLVFLVILGMAKPHLIAVLIWCVPLKMKLILYFSRNI